MPTEPLLTVIDRDLQIARAGKFLEVAHPLFQELVNYGSNALIRCATSSERGENEDLAALSLYRQIIELTDAFERLIASSCGTPTIPIVRSTFEALLSLDYILSSSSEYVRRSLSWLAVYLHKRINMYKRMLVDSPRGKEFQASLDKDKLVRDVPMPPQDKVREAIERLEGMLAREQFAEIQGEYASFERPPQWFRLFGGPASIQQLAYELDRHAHYDLLYRSWSTYAHAGDFSQFLAITTEGEGGIRGIRDAGRLQEFSRFEATFMVEATRIMLLEFRPGEDYSRYYIREVGDLFVELNTRSDFFT